MLKNIFEDKNFMKDYLPTFCGRLTTESLELSYEPKLEFSNHAVKFYNNFKAMQYLASLPVEEKNITNTELIEIANLVNGPSSFIGKGLRKTYVEVNTAKWIPCEANKIPMRMMSLWDCYYNVWDELDIFEREAMFHINFLKIHPFEDGNGRTGRVLLAHNLLKNNLAPVIITKEEKQKYFDYVEKDDYRGFADFLKSRSLEETEIIKQLYEEKDLETKKTR